MFEVTRYDAYVPQEAFLLLIAELPCFSFFFFWCFLLFPIFITYLKKEEGGWHYLLTSLYFFYNLTAGESRSSFPDDKKNSAGGEPHATRGELVSAARGETTSQQPHRGLVPLQPHCDAVCGCLFGVLFLFISFFFSSFLFFWIFFYSQVQPVNTTKNNTTLYMF